MFQNITLADESCKTFSEKGEFSNPCNSSLGNSSIQEEQYSCKNLLRKTSISFWRKINPELKRDVKSVSFGKEIPAPGFGDALGRKIAQFRIMLDNRMVSILFAFAH